MAVKRSRQYLAPYVKRGEEILDLDDVNVYDLIPDDHQQYTQDQILSAAATYLSTGNMTKAAQASKVKLPTISYWKRNSAWWPLLAKYIRRKLNDELDAKLTGIISKSVEEMHDRLENGEEVVTKDGQVIRRKVSYRDLAVGTGVAFDKRQLGRGEATARVEHQDQRELVNKLEQQFKRFATTKVVEGEILEKTHN